MPPPAASDGLLAPVVEARAPILDEENAFFLLFIRDFEEELLLPGVLLSLSEGEGAVRLVVEADLEMGFLRVDASSSLTVEGAALNFLGLGLALSGLRFLERAESPAAREEKSTASRDTGCRETCEWRNQVCSF